MDFDDVLPTLGGFGRYQIILYCALLIPTNFPLAFMFLSHVFVSATPKHWCKIPELDDHRIALDEVKNLSIPWEEREGEWQPSQCKMYDVNYTKVALDYLINNVSSSNKSWPVTDCKFGWNYDRSLYYNTLITKWDLVCDESWKSSLANSMFYVGGVVSQLLFGYVSDKWGRKPCMFIMLFFTILFGLASSYSPNYTAYIIFRGILGFTCASCYLTPFILITELTVPEKRCIIGMICGIFFSVALIVYTAAAYLLRDWFYISLMCSVPFIPILAYWWFVPESPRWLVSQNRIDEAEEIVQKIAKVNKKTIEKDFLKKFLQQKKKEGYESQTLSSSSYLELLKYPNMRCRQFILCFDWAIISLVYAVLVYNAMNMKIDDYLANAINSFSEIPGALIVMVAMDKIGRRLSLFLSMGIAGLGCLGVMFFPAEYIWTAIVLANIGKAGITGAFCLVFVYGCELFPTSLRNSALALPCLMGGIANVSSPFVLLLSRYQRTLPLILNGILCIAGAFAALILPETLNKHLPQTIEDGENMGINSCFMFWKRRKDVYNLDKTMK
ncbi:organic cation transporter protein-like [Centruroides sculpturatus]|uniref:organic cation transporter protein-like n=1 Tax=Centruroides sculpturatus TaxID=218467 RepID=UPI000C6ECB07|nr:organic cation transporter protein-like [Centruroides sculpturatus]